MLSSYDFQNLDLNGFMCIYISIEKMISLQSIYLEGGFSVSSSLSYFKLRYTYNKVY